MGEEIVPGPEARRITAFGGSHWAERQDYAEWLSGCILRRLQIAGTDIAVDFDCGFGRYAGPMAAYASEVVGVNKSAAMLNKIRRSSSGLTLVQASVEDVAGGQVRLPHDGYDVMLLRRTRQHLSDPAQLIAGLAGLLRPAGRMLVVTLPATPTYPLFTAALDLFPQLHAEPTSVASAMRAAGLRAELSYEPKAPSSPLREFGQCLVSGPLRTLDAHPHTLSRPRPAQTLPVSLPVSPPVPE